MMRSIRLLDLLQLAVFALALACVGYMAYSAKPAGHDRYEKALLAFMTAEDSLARQVQRVQTGAVSHFDDLAASVKELRRAEQLLNEVPRHVSGATTFSQSRLDLAVMVSETLALAEDFKTAHANFRIGVDALPRLIERAEAAVPAAAGDALALMLRVSAGLTAYVQAASPAIESHIAAQLTTLSAMGGEDSTPALQEALERFTRQSQFIVARKQALDGILREMSSVSLLAQGAQLSDAYHAAHESSRSRSAVALCALLAVLFVAFAGLARGAQWRAHKAARAVAARVDALKESVKEAKAQSAMLKRGEEEQSARLAEERHRALVEHAFDMMAVLSRQENYIYVSPASVALLGLTEKELIGKSVYEGIHADDIIKVRDYLTRAQKELQTEQTVQYRVMDAYGKWHLVEMFASNHASNPAVRGMVLNTRRLGPAPAEPPR